MISSEEQLLAIKIESKEEKPTKRKVEKDLVGHGTNKRTKVEKCKGSKEEGKEQQK